MSALQLNEYDRRIERAGELASLLPEAAELLEFYVELARLQKTVLESTEESRAHGTVNAEIIGV